MRTPPPRLIFVLFTALFAAACTPGPGPTDPDGPIIRSPEPVAAAQQPPRRLAALSDDTAVLSAPQCRACGEAGCARTTADDVCLVQCSSSGIRRWDLGLLGDRECDPAARNFCEANGLGRVTDLCWGGYS
jgi:hypothetical protein